MRLHKHQVFWQILLPVLLAVLLGLVAGGLTIMAGLEAASRTRLWADISIIWLVIQLLILGVIFLAVLVVVIVGLVKLLQITPRFTSRGQELAGRVEAGTKKIAGGAVSPFIRIHQVGAVIDYVIKKALGSTQPGGKE